MTRHYDLTITLDGVQPPPWRRFLITAEATFADLHRAIQLACGWEDRHLFEFATLTGESIAGLPEALDDASLPDASTLQLRTVLVGGDVTLRYLYDFGDDWSHTIRCEAVVESEERFHRRLLGGALAFPPEDCGGIGGYEQCLDAVRGGEDAEDDEEDENLREWLGDWDPERFDLGAARQDFDDGASPSSSPSPGNPATPEDIAKNVRAADRATLTAAAERVELLDRLRLFTDWAGTGRKLTATGNLTKAHGKELIDLLGTDDQLDPRIGDRVFKTQSTVDLPEVDVTFRLARSARFVKVRKGTVSSTKRGTRLGKDPLADWQAAFDGLLDLGVLKHRYAHATWHDPFWKEIIDQQVPSLLMQLNTAGRPVPLATLQEALWELVDAMFVLDDLTEEQLGRQREFLGYDVRHISRALAELGAVEVTDVETVTGPYGTQRETGGQVSLTVLGTAAVRERTGQSGATPIPRGTQTSPLDRRTLLERAGDLKQELVAYSQQPRYDRAMREMLAQHDDGATPLDEDRLMLLWDHFVLEYRLRNGRRVVEQFVDAHPELTPQERDLVLGWRDVVTGPFEVQRRDGDALILTNLVDELTYRAHSTMGPAVLRQMPRRSFLLTRLVAVGDEWIFSGPTSVLRPDEHEYALRLALDLSLKSPEAAYRNPEKLAKAWEYQRAERQRFIEHFGSDLVVLPGEQAQQRLDGFHAFARQEALRAAPESARRTYGSETSLIELPQDLVESTTVAFIYDEDEGFGFYAEFGMVQGAFADPELLQDARYRELVQAFVDDDSIEPMVLRRLAEQDPDRASELFRRLLDRPAFDWTRDGEEWLRTVKPEHFARPTLPRVTPLGERLAAFAARR